MVVGSTLHFLGEEMEILRSRNCEGSSQLTCFRETAASYDLDTPPKTNGWNLNKKAPWNRKKNITYRWWFFQYVVIFNFDLRILFRMGRKRKTPTTNNQPIFGGSKAVRFFGAAARMRMALAKAWPLNPWRRVSWEFVQIGNPRGFALMMIKERFFFGLRIYGGQWMFQWIWKLECQQKLVSWKL